MTRGACGGVTRAGPWPCCTRAPFNRRLVDTAHRRCVQAAVGQGPSTSTLPRPRTVLVVVVVVVVVQPRRPTAPCGINNVAIGVRRPASQPASRLNAWSTTHTHTCRRLDGHCPLPPRALQPPPTRLGNPAAPPPPAGWPVIRYRKLVWLDAAVAAAAAAAFCRSAPSIYNSSQSRPAGSQRTCRHGTTYFTQHARRGVRRGAAGIMSWLP